jgi:Holliday junction resolvase RusA-like endonuclease
MEYSIKVRAIPIAQPRARAVAFQGRARMHDAPKSHAIHDYKASVRMAVAEQIPAPLKGPLALSIVFIMPRPQSHFRSGAMSDRLKDSAPRWHTSKPDLDNLIKGAKDALKGVAWDDDSQVAVYPNCEKRYVSGKEQPPQTLIEIREIT